MLLPLKERATAHHPHFRLITAEELVRGNGLVPATAPAAGEQYRFHFDLTKCIGCHCCEVACHEQNNLPANIHWRQVGEIEGGEYPWTQRLHLSMGCNHCLEPACLNGCPVDAYKKDTATGIVLHSADACIGCQYCTWNCPYGVPQFNEERGVVGKCDMCHGRLTRGQTPACANACPEGAIRIEKVAVVDWRNTYTAAANAPGLPDASLTVSTTRVTLPDVMPAELNRVDRGRVGLEDPHTPLIFMTVMTQLAAGAFAGLPSGHAAVGALLALHLGLAASLLHLGRPAFAYRALKMWRRSWLSREVLVFSLFALAATASVAGVPGMSVCAAVIGIVGVAVSARLYLVPGRPAWQSWRTIAEFLLTAAILGPLFTNSFVHVSIGAAVLQAGIAWDKYRWMRSSKDSELRASAELLSGRLVGLAAVRWIGLAIALVLSGVPALLVAMASELLGRYLFFVSVVPRNVAGVYQNRRAA